MTKMYMVSNGNNLKKTQRLVEFTGTVLPEDKLKAMEYARHGYYIMIEELGTGMLSVTLSNERTYFDLAHVIVPDINKEKSEDVFHALLNKHNSVDEAIIYEVVHSV